MSRRARTQRDKRAEAFDYLSLGPADVDAFEAVDEAELLEHEAAEPPPRNTQHAEPAHG